ncbi:MAG: TolC family protein [Prolixibacteraceae bacterium]|nr:TolC family protein [Prolixibacteraceae bacterium]MBN2650204.1 TolC family protein [Prolixibacteraceae bacterium]
MKYFISLLTLLMIATGVFAQEQWTLLQCIDYAHEHNIMIQQYELSTHYQENQLQQSKYNRLPNLSANVSQGVNFGRSLTIDNTYESITSASTGLSASTNVLLWQGGTLRNAIMQNEYGVKSSFEDLQKAKDDVALNITAAYLDILFARELLLVAEKQAEQTQSQLNRSTQLVDAGSLPQGALLEIEAQLAREQLEMVNSENQLRLATLVLAQMLELDSYNDFSIVQPVFPELRAQMSIMESEEVYEKALQNRPEIKRAAYQLESTKVQLDIAKGSLYPTLSASAGIYDDYLNTSAREVTGFFDQLADNHRESLGLNLSIPIFSRFSNRTNIDNARLQIENQKLEVESVKKELRRQIEQAQINAVAALKRYTANKTAVKSMQESLRYIEEKYNVGRVNPVEYNNAKTNLAIAESNLLQAKYDFIFRSKILDFYNGTPIEL